DEEPARPVGVGRRRRAALEGLTRKVRVPLRIPGDGGVAARLPVLTRPVPVHSSATGEVVRNGAVVLRPPAVGAPTGSARPVAAAEPSALRRLHVDDAGTTGRTNALPSASSARNGQMYLFMFPLSAAGTVRRPCGGGNVGPSCRRLQI